MNNKKTHFKISGDRIPLDCTVSLESAVKRFEETLKNMVSGEEIEWVVQKQNSGVN